jgi:hypothetical protein
LEIANCQPGRVAGYRIGGDHSAGIRLLRDDEIEAVTGGLVVNAIIAVLIGMLIPDLPKRTY